MAKEDRQSLGSTIVADDFTRVVDHNQFSDPRLTPDYTGSYNSFSGADIKALIVVPAVGIDKDGNVYEEAVLELENLQTLTYSIYREKSPVRALGFIGEKGKARGTRTIAGSIVFTVFDRHALWNVLRIGQGDRARNAINQDSGFLDMEYVLPDQLPPFDIVVHFANEYGHAAELVLFGVELGQEGQVMSVQDMITENVMQFTAQHIAIMRPGGHRKTLNLTEGQTDKTFKSIMNRTAHSEGVKTLIRSAVNPFR